MFAASSIVQAGKQPRTRQSNTCGLPLRRPVDLKTHKSRVPAIAMLDPVVCIAIAGLAYRKHPPNFHEQESGTRMPAWICPDCVPTASRINYSQHGHQSLTYATCFQRMQRSGMKVLSWPVSRERWTQRNGRDVRTNRCCNRCDNLRCDNFGHISCNIPR